ncbi:MAG: energy-coupled thiamine transporter ThiT [Anaeroplasmataceae bacterium]
MKKKKMLDVKTLAEIAIFAAIGYVLDLIAGACSSFLPFINGGSVGIAMVAVLVIAIRRGTIPGLITGLIIGLLDLMDGFYAISDAWWKILLQVGLDYVFAYTLVGLAGLFRGLIARAKTKSIRGIFVALAAVCGGALKFMSHFLSGILFWPENPTDKVAARITYSIVYNGGYMLPSIILSGLVIVAIVTMQPQLFLLEDSLDEVSYEG